jgi:hypothetical protein
MFRDPELLLGTFNFTAGKKNLESGSCRLQAKCES